MNRGGVNAAAKIALALLAILGEALNFPLSAAAQQDLDYTGNSTATQPEVVALSGSVTACPVGQRMGPDSPNADPRLFFSGQDTALTVTSVVPADPTLIPGTVTLLQVDSSGNQIAVLGQMYDDGTHGDATAGDGMYTAQPTVNIPTAGRIYLAVQAKYSGPPGCRQSDNNEREIIVNGTHPSQVQTHAEINAIKAGGAYYRKLVAPGGKDAGNPSQAAQDLVNYMMANFPGVVVHATASASGTDVGVKFSSGRRGSFDLSPAGEM
ncbi:MAG TPA: choice-of-anchor X domain-containing protein [Candidatus Binataceae bacterium]|nr:choice-of-anchor X domain-containing protein [Candidatus Binataceae bacterium]